MKIIDLRSDTVTRPTEEMRRAMYDAEVGDDVYGEDKTVNTLESLAAEKLGKEAGLFVASGTMSNLIAILAQTARGDEIIVGDESHVFWYEVGGASALAGVVIRTVPNQPDGKMSVADLEAAIRTSDIHFPRTALICLENTHNRCGGTVLDVGYTKEAVQLAHRHGLGIHLDGARLCNAAVALGVSLQKLAEGTDTVGICLSKGLSAPVGSVLCGSGELIADARKWRKMLGGGMRQAGVIAAAGIIALETMIDRLTEDHQHAREFALGLHNIKGVTVSQPGVDTNIVFFRTDESIDPSDFILKLKDEGILLSSLGERQFRIVTHREISALDIDRTLTAIQKTVSYYYC